MVISMQKWNGKVAVVTGASSGIGAAISEALVKEGVQVVGLARRKEKVEELSKKFSNCKGKLFAVQADVTKEEELIRALQWTKKNLGPVSILINNAGLALVGNLIDSKTEIFKNTFDVNVLGLCVATREVVKIMRENNIDGQVVNINSVAGHQVPPIPGLNVYAASKFAVTALTETLRQELNSIKSKIKVTSISPGLVKSDFQQSAGIADKIFEDNSALMPQDIAEAVVFVLSTPPHVQIQELTIKPLNEKF